MAKDIDATLAALAEPTRRHMVEMLRERPRRAGELAAAFDQSAPAISKHLRVLRTSGLIEEERVEHDARVRIYRLRPEPFADLQAWLERVQSFWAEQLDAFKDYAEGTRGESR
jgi:DNA-binding transcriptional ArsR family regulator